MTNTNVKGHLKNGKIVKPYSRKKKLERANLFLNATKAGLLVSPLLYGGLGAFIGDTIYKREGIVFDKLSSKNWKSGAAIGAGTALGVSIANYLHQKNSFNKIKANKKLTKEEDKVFPSVPKTLLAGATGGLLTAGGLALRMKMKKRNFSYLSDTTNFSKTYAEGRKRHQLKGMYSPTPIVPGQKKLTKGEGQGYYGTRKNALINSYRYLPGLGLVAGANYISSGLITTPFLKRANKELKDVQDLAAREGGTKNQKLLKLLEGRRNFIKKARIGATVLPTLAAIGAIGYLQTKNQYSPFYRKKKE